MSEGNELTQEEKELQERQHDEAKKEYENERKKKLFGKIYTHSSSFEEAKKNWHNMFSYFKKSGININSNVDVKNIPILTNNKIISLQHEFEKAGINLYDSIIGTMVICNILNQGIDSINILLNKLIELINELNKDINKEIEMQDKESKFKKLISRIFPFANRKREKIKLIEEHNYEKNFNNVFEEYSKTYDNIDNFDITDLIKDGDISNFIRELGLNNPILSTEMDSIISQLTKLGYKDSIKDIKNQLPEEYKLLFENRMFAQSLTDNDNTSEINKQPKTEKINPESANDNKSKENNGDTALRE